nr:MAG TPA: Putative tail protein [Caudoviricetes sp.]
MSKLNIYHKDGSFLTDANEEQITIKGLEYSDSWMGECFVTISIKNAAPVKFEIGDYIMYRGERFELNYDPGKQKQARKDSYGDGFVYDSVKFNALQDELSRTEFLDVVLNDNQLHYTSLPKFQFYVETIDDLLDRIQANLNEQIDVGKWKIFSRSKSRSMQRGVTEAEWDEAYGEGTEDFSDFDSKSITIDSKTCWEALALSNSEWDINFIVRNRCVYVGTAGVTTQNIFKYGLGNGLYEIDQNADSDQSIITRLRAYGSEKNLPEHYYADLGSTPFLNITGDYNASSTENGLSVMLENSEFNGMFTNIKSENGSNMKRVLVSCKIDDYLFDAELELVLKEGTTCTTRLLIDNDKTVSDAVKAKIDAGFKQVLFLSGAKATKFNKNRINYVQNLPNNMSINRLMLPGFPRLSLKEFWDSLTDEEKKYVNPSRREHVFSTDKYRPYIDSINLEKIGLRSASQFFDTDDKTNGVIEIYPTIEEMEIGGVRVDEIYTGSNVEDNGRFDDGQTVANIDIYLNPAIDFDINDLRNDDFTISMKDGMCGGRDLKVASCSKIDGKWRLTIERVKDDALNLWFPYKDYQIKKGDHFVLTGIELPDSYIRAASLKLLKYAIALLDKNDYTRYVYQPKVDEIFMARQHDQAMDDKTGTIKSLHDTLKAGDLMRFEDEDLGIDAEITIDQLTIKEEDGKIPTYDITLREDKEVGTIQKIQQQISSLESGNGGNGGGLTASQVKSQVASEGSKYFLSKLKDDTAAGIITFQLLQKFLKGIKVGANGDWTLDELDNTHLTTDYLQVRMKAIFETLEILHTDTSGGELFITPVGSNRILKVEEVNITYDGVSQKAYRCYFLGEQDGSKVENKWKVGDQARSKSFNLTQGKYHNVGNHYYWRLVIGVSTETVEIDGKKYHYVDLSDIDKDAASDEPMVDDILNQCGNRADNARQSCLVFSAVDTYSPSVTLYHGVNGYTFNNKEYVAYGVNHSTNKAFFHVYGDMYFGDRPTSANNYEGDSYVKYDSDKKKVTIKGDLDIKSTYDGKTLDKYITEKSLDKDAVETIIKKSETITDLQNQIDGAIETWFYEGVPTLDNAPAISWKTDKDKKTHLGDLYYDNKTGKAYRFAKDGSTYKWIIIKDTELTKALEDSSQALKDAKSKRRIFGYQPVPPYDVNDMWVNATYPSDGSTYKNEILKCAIAKAEGGKFDIADWKLASKYTDDTKAEEAKKAAEKAQEEIENTQTNLITLGTTVSDNKKAFDAFTSDGYLDSSEIAAIAQDSKRLEDDYNAAVESYNNVVGSKFLLDKDGKDTTYKTDLVSAKATLDSAKNGLIHFLSDIVSRYNASDSDEKAAIKVAAAQKYTNFTNAYKAFYDKLGVANNYITSNLFEGLNTKLITNMAGLEYIKAALVDGNTVVKGGLILSTLIALRNDKGNVTAGINGADTKENGIALWLGGKAIDRQASTTKEDEMDSAAKALLRFDGTGYFANGNLWWDADGTLHADPTSFIINKNNVGVQLALFAPVWKSGTTDTTKLANVLAIDPQKPFTHLDVSGNVTTEGSVKIGDIVLAYDSQNEALKVYRATNGKSANLYTTGGITAYGSSSVSGGGGGLNATVKLYEESIKLTSDSRELVASAYSIKALDSRISSLEGGSATAISVSGSGNAVTSVTKNGTTISVVKGATFLTSHQSLANYYTTSQVDNIAKNKSDVGHTHSYITDGTMTTITGWNNEVNFGGTNGSNVIYFSYRAQGNKPIISNFIFGGSTGSATIQAAGFKINGGSSSQFLKADGSIDNNNYLTSHQSLSNYYTKSETDSKLNGYLPLSGGTMQANARITHGDGNLYIGNTNNSNWVAVQDICSQSSIGDGIWSIRVDGTAHFQSIKFPSNRLIAQVSNGSNSPLKGIKLPNLQSNAIGIFSRVGNGTDEGGIVLSEDTCVIYNSFDTGWGLSVRDKDLNQTDISSDDTVAFGIRDTYKLYSRGGFEKKDSSDDYVLLGGGGHSKITDLSVANADTVDGVHIEWAGSLASALWLTAWENNGSKLRAISPTNINAGSATKLQTPRTIWGQSFDGTGNVDGELVVNGGNVVCGIKINSDISEGSISFNGADGGYRWVTGRYNNRYFIWNNGHGEVFSISNNTNFGIGTISPTYKLHVAGDIYSSDRVIANNSVLSNKLYSSTNPNINTPNKCIEIAGNTIREYHSEAGGSPYYSNITLNDTSLYLSAYGNIDISAGLGTIKLATGGSIELSSYSGFSIIYRGAEFSVAQTNGNEFTWSMDCIKANGNILATGGITAYSSSDLRLKQDLRKLDYLGIIKAMGGTFGFAWKKDNTRSIGFIAQHVLSNPHLKDIVETDEKGYYKINYWSPKLIATAFGAIEQVGDEVSRLKARVVFLESEVQRLSGKQDGNNKKRLDNKNINLLN